MLSKCVSRSHRSALNSLQVTNAPAALMGRPELLSRPFMFGFDGIDPLLGLLDELDVLLLGKRCQFKDGAKMVLEAL
jgi:hypothetical protein